jgi:hypothetical protein
VDRSARSRGMDCVTGVVRQVKAACQEIAPTVKIMLNTLPFPVTDFDNAREKVFGQHIESLAEVVDVFEVMTYHQILNRSTNWISEVGQEVKTRSGQTTICTLQARSLYLEGMYTQDHRSPALDAEEFAEAVATVKDAALDGIVVFVWSDLLKAAFEQGDTRRIDAIHAVVKRR